MQKLNYDTILQESRANAHELNNQRSFLGYNWFDTEVVAIVILLLFPNGNFAAAPPCLHPPSKKEKVYKSGI
jgi:hypothetical protein